MKGIMAAWVMAEVLLMALAMAMGGQEQKKPAGESPASTQAAALPALTDDEKKDLTILNQAMTIQAQRYQLLQAQLADVQQQHARLAAEREQRLAKAKQEHKWGEEVKCNLDELTCARVAPPAKK